MIKKVLIPTQDTWQVLVFHKTAKAGSKLRFESAYPYYVSLRPDRGTGDRETAGVYNDSKKAHGLSAASVRHGCFMEAGVTQSAGSDRLIT